MIGMVVAVPRVTKRRKSLRDLARLIIAGRDAEMARLHAERDACAIHAIQAGIQMGYVLHHLPERLTTPEATHARIEMPAARTLARREAPSA